LRMDNLLLAICALLQVFAQYGPFTLNYPVLLIKNKGILKSTQKWPDKIGLGGRFA